MRELQTLPQAETPVACIHSTCHFSTETMARLENGCRIIMADKIIVRTDLQELADLVRHTDIDHMPLDSIPRIFGSQFISGLEVEPLGDFPVCGSRKSALERVFLRICNKHKRGCSNQTCY